MADFLTKAERSHRMSLIRSKNTRPEIGMAKMLDEAGINYVRHAKLPGSPDFLLDSFVVLFVDGDFWHGRNFDKISPRLAPFWKKKLINNIRRDARVDKRLRRMGFSVIRIWETNLRKKPERCLRRIASVERRQAEENKKDVLRVHRLKTERL